MDWRMGCIVLATAALGACQSDAGPAAQSGASGAAVGSGAAAAAKGGLPKLTEPMPSSISADRPPAKTGDDPKADYKTFNEIYKAGPTAIGKTLLFRGYGTPLKENLTRLSEAKPSTEKPLPTVLEVTFPISRRDLMRAMPSSQFVAQGQVPRVHVKITGLHDHPQYLQGEVIDVYDLQPDPPPARLPSGVDFLSIDDVFLAGADAVGKVADFGVYAGQRDARDESWALVATGCSPHGGWEAQLYVAENDANRDFIQALDKAGGSTCARVRAKITMAPTAAAPSRWGAELVGIGAQFPKPQPGPNP
jgi:hypothetical protein